MGTTRIHGMRLRTKLLLAYIGLSTILFTSGGLIALHLVKRAVKSNIESNLNNGTHAIISLVETSTQASIENYLRAVSEKNLEIAKAIHQRHLAGEYTEKESRKKIRATLLSQTIGRTGYIYCIDSQGVATVHPNAGVEGKDWSQFKFIHKQIEMKTGYIEYQWKNPGEPAERPKALYMSYFEPYDWIISVSTYRNEFIELLPMEAIRQRVKALKFGASGYVFVADSHGNILIHPELEGQNLFELGEKDTQFFEKMVQEGFGQVIYYWQNPGEAQAREKIALYGYIPEFDWIVGSTGYVEEIYSSIQSARHNAIYFIGVALLLSTMLTLFISNYITRRLNHLMAVITKGEQGNLAVRAEPGADDEIGRLARIYNAFTKRLQSYHEKLDIEIEKHRTTAESLKRSQALFQVIFDQTFQLIGILHPNGIIRDFNQTALDFAGIKKTDVVGRNFLDRPFWSDAKISPKDIEHAIEKAANAELARMEVTHVDLHGQTTIIDFSLKPVIDADGSVALLIAEGRDISERKRAEEEIRKSDERLKLALESVSDAIWDWRVDTGEGYLSPRWYKMLGYEPDELPQAYETWINLLHPDDRSTTEQIVHHHLASGDPFELECRMRTKDGRWRWILDRGKTVERDGEGNPLRVLGTHMDITDRKMIEERMQQSQKMEAIGTLAGGIAHDFNNILGGIFGYAQLAQLSIQDNPKAKKYIDQLCIASDRAKGLVQQILAFSRQSKSEKVPTDIGLVTKEALKLLRASIPTTIEIEQNVQSHMGAVEADPNQIHQIVMNICTNAFHAIHSRSGSIRLDLEKIEIASGDALYPKLRPGMYLKLSVTDTGQGMDAATVARIFEPYFTTKAKGEGTGMGLAVVHGIVKDHGGDIKVVSELDVGSTFEIVLPIMEESLVAELHEPKQSLDTGYETILLVDDEKFLVDINKDILERLGYRVFTRTSSHEALKDFKAQPDNYDLIITDMTMPEMTGDQFAREVKKIREDIPIILCTGFSEKVSPDSVKEMGIDDFLMKPVPMEALAKSVRSALDHVQTE
jgi:PAS domain S-box-containing protein